LRQELDRLIFKFKEASFAISSDDVFSLKKAPGKTLVVGGGYVAVEIAGFLKGMGFDVTLMTRGDYLRSFDRDMVKYIMKDLEQRKIDIRQTSLPEIIRKNQ
jgi:pyruvate/2-oxoglutarate dehydrogenase complex dihydrolipoamide dehydrogenase (E3) component